MNYQEIENNIYNDIENRIKQGFTNIVGLSLLLDIPNKYEVLPNKKKEEEEPKKKKKAKKGKI